MARTISEVMTREPRGDSLGDLAADGDAEAGLTDVSAASPNR